MRGIDFGGEREPHRLLSAPSAVLAIDPATQFTVNGFKMSTVLSTWASDDFVINRLTIKGGSSIGAGEHSESL